MIRQRLAARPASTRIWILVFALALATMAVWDLLPAHPADATSWLRWWMLAPMFVATETAVVHIHFRREAFSFSLGEMPLIAALLLSSTTDLMVGQIVGTAFALAVIRRQPPMKLAFNVTNSAANTTVAVAVFWALHGGGDSLAPGVWPAFFAATLLAAASNTLLIVTAVSISEGRPRFAKMMQVNLFGFVVAVTNTCLGLTAAIVIGAEPLAAVLLFAVLATLFTAYRAYANERRHHESLEFLYESTRALHQTAEWEAAITTLLSNACSAFRAARAEIVLAPVESDGELVRTTFVADPGGEQGSLQIETVGDDAERGELRELIKGLDRAIVSTGRRGGVEAPYFDRRGFSAGMLTPLQGEQRRVGLLVVADRTTDVSGFSESELRLFETVSASAALSLENDQLEQSIAQLTDMERKLSFQAFHDPLTGLVNRRRFAELVEERLADDDGASVLFIDLDDFKAVNDSLGHGAGDAVLMAVAARIQGCLRGRDVAARLGGDEFGVLVCGTESADAVAARLLPAICEPVAIDGSVARVGASIGIATAPAGSDADALLRDADIAMYAAKTSGKRCIERFTTDMAEVAATRRSLRSELERAIDRGELETHFQPIVDLVDGETRAAEALARWRHPTRGLLTAGAFIGLLDEGGLRVPVWSVVLRQSLTAAALLRESSPDIRISMNLSGTELGDVSIVERVAEAISVSGVDPSALILEITETAVMADIEANLERLTSLRELGVLLALDDFGTGHSSLGHLRQFPIDILKLAKEFTDAIGSDVRDRKFVETVVELGHLMGMQVIAEGVETSEQATALRSMGCDLAQGFLYATALPIQQMERFLRRSTTEISLSVVD